MPRFRSVHACNMYLSASYKVMFSTLMSSNALESKLEMAFACFGMPAILAGRAEHYVLVRNPYDRLVSVFNDKLREDPRRRLNAPWQYSQRRVLGLLSRMGVRGQTFEAQRQILLSLTFEQFVALVPGMLGNGHVAPQSALLQCCSFDLRGRSIILRMERDLGYLSDIFRIDCSVRRNETKHESFDAYFSAKCYQVANIVYATDFALFGYLTYHS